MKYSVLSLIIVAFSAAVGCAKMQNKASSGAALGAASGAAVGGVIGNRSGATGAGALIGAGVGGILGGVIGNRLDQQNKELNQVAESKRTEDGIVTKLKGDVLFDSNAATIKPEARGNIDQLADIVKKYPEDKLTIVGHADSSGHADSNQRLSEQRARAVMVEMLSRGVPQEGLIAVGMGDSQPAASNKTPEGRFKNRRVELKIGVDDAKLQGKNSKRTRGSAF